jgi:hypothetical protein
VSSLLPEVEGWIKALGAVVALLMAVAVPVRSWLVEDRRFRAQALEAAASASRTTLAGVSGASAVLADGLALAALTEAANRVAAALETLVETGEARERDRLTVALERFLARHAEER